MSDDKRKQRFEWGPNDIKVVTPADLERLGIKPIPGAPAKPARSK